MNLFNWIKNLFSKKEINNDWRNGCLPSPVDFRDVKMKDVLGAASTDIAPLPDKYRIPYILTIKDQGTTSECVAYSCSTIKEFLERREGNAIEFDPDWIYKKCKEIDGIPDYLGTYLRTGLTILKNLGAKPLNGSEADAAKYKIGGYIQVNVDFNSIKRAIYEFGAVLMGFVGDNTGWQTAFIKVPKIPVWGHATVGISFDVQYIDGQNSWSEQWGDKGLFHFLETYKPFECWAVTVDRPNEFLPDPNAKPKYVFKNNLLQGINNDEVKVLQDCLKWLGCMEKTQESTGYFGLITYNAVKVFQGRYNIFQTGNVGPLTINKLNELFK